MLHSQLATIFFDEVVKQMVRFFQIKKLTPYTPQFNVIRLDNISRYLWKLQQHSQTSRWVITTKMAQTSIENNSNLYFSQIWNGDTF